MINKIKPIPFYIFLTLISFLAVYPFIIMTLGSLKTASEFSGNPAGLPMFPTPENYIRLFNYSSGIIIRSFANSVFISTTYTIITLFISSLAAFAFAKYKFKGRNIIFMMLLATMMIPIEVNIPPMYLL